ncbi:MAG: C_GCAxxG_C_C family protein [Selenomonas ruminantium]|nr:C_GCAxxG_C_C family protein [Selenomonas ruminantium]
MENTSKRAEQAAEYKKKFNCAQAVIMAFKEEIGLSEENLLAMGSGFGSGMGGMEATCGALCGAAMTMGFLNKSGQPTKLLTSEMLAEFKEKAGATICKDLKGIGTGKVLCPCPDCVRIAAMTVEKRI